MEVPPSSETQGAWQKIPARPQPAYVDRDIYVCTRLKPKKVWDICIDDDDDQKQFRASSSIAHADTYDHMGAYRGAQKWKIVEWNHGGIWK